MTLEASTIGGVSVEVQADIGKLLEGFQAAQKATAQFDRAVGAKASAAAARFEKSTASAGRAASKTAASTGELQRAADRIAKAYDPVVAAAYRYERELKDIDLLHRHGIIGADRHALYLRKAARAYREAEMAAKGYGAAGRAAVPAMGLGRTAIAGALASVSATALLGQSASLADEAKRIDAQLKLATQSFGDFNQAQRDTIRISAETRNGLEPTAKLYGNFLRATEAVGGTQADAARATETFAKALKLGGASTAEASAATLQFGQALASGTLRGDELNSVMEASPRLAKLIADSLGVTVGELRKMGEEGEIGADRLYAALTDRKFTEGIDAEFKLLPVTFGDAMQRVHDAAVITFGAFDRGGDFSNSLASFITQGSDGFAGLERDAEALGRTIRTTLAGLSNAFEPLLINGQNVAAALSATFRTMFLGVNFNIENSLKALDLAANSARANPLISGPWGVLLTEKSDLAGSYRRGRDRKEQELRAPSAAEAMARGLGFGGGQQRQQVAPGNQLQVRVRQLTAEYDKLAGAQDKYKRDMADIAKAEAEGMIPAERAAVLRREAAEALEKVRTAQNRTPGGGTRRAARETDDYSRALQQMAERTADVDLKLRALTENLPEREIEATRLQTELYSIAQDKSKKLTDAQREALKREADAIVEKTRQLRDAEIAQDRANIKAEQYIELMERLSKPLEVEINLDSLDYAVAQVRDYFQNLNERTDAFAEDFAGAFDRAAESVLKLESPLDIIRNLFEDLAATFQRAFILDPIKDWVKERFAAPVAEKLIGGKASTSGIQVSTFNANLQTASVGLTTFSSALQQATTAALTKDFGTSGPLIDANQQFTGDAPLIRPETVTATNDALGMLDQAATGATQAFRAQIPALGQFGSAVSQAFAMLASGGSGGGFLGSLLKIGSIFAGSIGGAATSAGTDVVYGGTLGGIYRDGGIIPGFATGGRMRDGMIRGPGTGTSDSILAVTPGGPIRVSAGEMIIREKMVRKHLPMLEAINADRMPGFASGGIPETIAATRDWDSIPASRMVHFGEGPSDRAGRGDDNRTFNIAVNVPAGMDDRAARRTGKQVGAELRNQISIATRSGF
jgi:tape measure domain-containing protein